MPQPIKIDSHQNFSEASQPSVGAGLELALQLFRIKHDPNRCQETQTSRESVEKGGSCIQCEMAGGEDEVKVIGWWPSPLVARPRIALNLKRIRYEFVEETFGIKSELLLESNPVFKRVPILLHNDKIICESMSIVQYIDEVWSGSGPALLPSDPYDSSVARFWAVYNDEKFRPAIFKISTTVQTAEAKAEAVEQVFAGLQLYEEAFKKCSKGKEFFGGETIGYLDIAIGSHLGWIRAAEVMAGDGVVFLDEGKTPLLVGWAQRFCSDAAVKEVMPKVEKTVEFAKWMKDGSIQPSPLLN